MTNPIILLDTNIISTFSKIPDLDYLFEFTKKEVVYISTSVLREFEEAKGYGFDFVIPVLNLIESEKIIILSMNMNEVKWSMKLPDSFGNGERDSISICHFRKGIFITNERRVINYCYRNGISSINLATILRESWIRGLKTKEEVKSMMYEIESKDNIIFKNKDIIFKEK